MSDPATLSLQDLVDRFLSEERFAVSPSGQCPYLPARSDRAEWFPADELSPAVYERLMDRGFRRNGSIIYRPACESCADCRQLRVCVAGFRSGRSLRRVWRRNHDVRVEAGRPDPTPEKLRLFRRYLSRRHDGTMTGSEEEFHDFLYTSPVQTVEFRYLLGRRLVGVSLADRGPRSLSSVYMFFEPAQHRRSLGTFSILWEIDYCRREALPHYYLGFFVPDCPAMAYKARYRPCEVLQDRRRWVALDG